jgi:hypothetical protein
MYPRPMKPTFFDDDEEGVEEEEARARMRVCRCRWCGRRWRRVGEGLRKAKAVVSWRRSMLTSTSRGRDVEDEDNGGIGLWCLCRVYVDV